MVATFIAAQEQSHLQLAQERRQRFGAQPPSISFNITAEERKARFERLNNSVTVPAPTPPSYPHDNTGNAVHSYYTNSVNHVKDPFSSIHGGGEDEGEEDEGDGNELEGEDEEFGESDNEIPS